VIPKYFLLTTIYFFYFGILGLQSIEHKLDKSVVVQGRVSWIRSNREGYWLLETNAQTFNLINVSSGAFVNGDSVITKGQIYDPFSSTDKYGNRLGQSFWVQNIDTYESKTLNCNTMEIIIKHAEIAEYLEGREGRNFVIAQDGDWRALWKKLDPYMEATLPSVDFSQCMIIGVSRQFGNSGYSITISSVAETSNNYEVYISSTR
jgi:hypothetical protein